MLRANSRKKTEWEPKHWRSLASLTILIVLLFGWGEIARAPEAGQLQIKGQIFNYEAADTPGAQEKGLGGRDYLPFDRAMLFRFPSPGRQCFWMKDMRFNLDIIWLSSSKKVVHIEPNLSPNTYPQSYCAGDTQYVVEVNANNSQELGLHEGDIIRF